MSGKGGKQKHVNSKCQVQCHYDTNVVPHKCRQCDNEGKICDDTRAMGRVTGTEAAIGNDGLGLRVAVMLPTNEVQ